MLENSKTVPTLDKSRVRNSFGQAASSYDEWANLQRRIGDRLLKILPANTLEPLSVLDLGAGTGYCTRQLSLLGHSVVALDIAPAMLSKARSLQRFKTHYVCGDAEFLPLKDQCIDIVFSNLAIQWCCDLDRLFTEVQRVLRPGGMFLFSTFGPETLSELRNAWKQVDLFGHVNEFYARSALGDAIARSGLCKSQIESELMTVDYRNVMELMRELKGLGAHNVMQQRSRTLTGKNKLMRMVAEYEKITMNQGIFATFELILGRCIRPL